MIVVLITAFFIVAVLVCFVYAVLWMKEGFQLEEVRIQMFRMWADAQSDFNLQISTSEEPINFQVAVDQPIEMATDST